MNVFDSSAIYKSIKSNKHQILSQGYTCPLAYFELGNIVLKNSFQFKFYSSAEAQDILKICDIVLSQMRILNTDMKDIYEIASKLQLSFYDAAYVSLAKQLNIPLITLDKKLIHKANYFVKTIHFEYL